MYRPKSHFRAIPCVLGLSIYGFVAPMPELHGAARSWDANGVSPPNGNFNVAANWSPDIVPVVGDAVTFNSGNAVITFTANAASDSATVSTGPLAFRSDSAIARTYDLTTGSGLSVTGGADLTIGATGLPMNLSASGVFVGQAVSMGNPSTIILSGAGSSLQCANLSIAFPLVPNDLNTSFQVNAGTSLNVSSTTLMNNGFLTINGGQVSLGQFAGGNVIFASGSLSYLGNLTVGAGGMLGGNLSLASDRQLTLSGTTTINSGSTLTIDSTSFSTGSLVNNGGTIAFNSGTLGITGVGGLVFGAAGPFGGSYTAGPGRTFNVTNTTLVEPGAAFVLNGGTLNTGSLLVRGTFDYSGTFTASGNGAVLIEQAGQLIASDSINERIAGIGSAGILSVSASGISLGDAAVFNGFDHEGVLNVGVNTVTLNSAGYASIGSLTSLSGGMIHAPNGIAMASGTSLQGSGTVTARITGESGSLIDATGAIVLGNSASPAGFNFAGELRTRQHAVTLNSSAQATLGNLTTLGNGVTPGTLNATNGIVVDFGDAITGHGTVNTTNTLAKRTIVNGIAQGTSIAQPLTFSGYVKGVGTFSNVNFTGTFSPGLSPTILPAGNIGFANSSVIEIELGGTTAGSGYDQIQSDGTMALDGTLAISLINAFTPVAGNSFQILTFQSRTGNFDDVTGDYFGQGLFLKPVFTSSTLTLLTTQAGIGDSDLDGDIDLNDLSALAGSYGANHPAIDWLNGDFDHDNDVDLNDLSSLAAHYGSGEAQAFADFAAIVSVPEPSLCGMATLAIVPGLAMRRRPTVGRALVRAG
jgi:hypothetical protein